MNNTEKGLWKRTIQIFTKIKIPWYLYIINAILGVLTTKIALTFIPLETSIQLGEFDTDNLIFTYLGLMLVYAIINAISNVPSFYAKAMVQKDLQKKMVWHALRMPMASFEKHASRIASWVTNDTTTANGLIVAIVGFFTGIVSTFMTVSKLSTIEISFISLVPFLLIYVLFSTWVEGKLMFLRQRKGKQANAELTAYLAEHLTSFMQIKQLHGYKEESKRGTKAIDDYYKADIYVSVLVLLGNVISGSITDIINILVFVLGVPKVRDGVITMADLVAFQNYILLAYGSLASFPQLYTDFMYYNGDLFYIGNLMDEKEEVYTRGLDMNFEDEDIVFDHVSFAYQEDKILKDVSFTIPKGEITMLVGPNGSGKTTIFKLLERFYTPQEGSISFGTHLLEDIDLQPWRETISYVLQEPELLNRSIKDNIRYGLKREVKDEEIIEAARFARADDFIQTMPGKYDFVIGEGGSRLSAGQRQRLAIARAVMLDPAYLLLDEATCNLDLESQDIVNEALFNLMKDRTTVMITHDLHLLDKADNIIVLHNGEIECCGKKEDVLKTSKILKQMVGGEYEIKN